MVKGFNWKKETWIQDTSGQARTVAWPLRGSGITAHRITAQLVYGYQQTIASKKIWVSNSGSAKSAVWLLEVSGPSTKTQQGIIQLQVMVSKFEKYGKE